MRLNVAIDGPVGAGKSTVADAVAARLGILHLDTGAMYRALGLTALRRGVDVQDEQAVVALCLELDISVSYEEDGQHTFVEGEDVTGLIRTQEVSMAASTVSRYAEVRRAMVRVQQKLAAQTDMLLDGRDICTTVLPNATAKIFLTAAPEERARRRREAGLALSREGLDVLAIVQQNYPLSWPADNLPAAERRKLAQAIDGFVEFYLGYTWDRGRFSRALRRGPSEGDASSCSFKT